MQCLQAQEAVLCTDSCVYATSRGGYKALGPGVLVSKIAYSCYFHSFH